MKNKIKTFALFILGKYGFIWSKINFFISFVYKFNLHKQKKLKFKKKNLIEKNLNLEILNNLNKNGYSICNVKDIYDKPNELFNFLEKQVKDKQDHINATKKSFFHNIYEVNIGAGRDELIDFAISKNIIEIISNYLNIFPIISGVQIIKSDINKNFFSSMNWHFDSHHNKLIKIIFPIHNLNDKHGPTTFLDKITTNKLIKKNFLFKSPRYFEDSEIKSYLPNLDDKIIKFLGKKGEVLLIDTSKCFHMGSRCEKIRYQTFITYNPILTNDLDTLNFSSEIKYINNLIQNIENNNHI